VPPKLTALLVVAILSLTGSVGIGSANAALKRVIIVERLDAGNPPLVVPDQQGRQRVAAVHAKANTAPRD
jgi:hypothetical protein